MGSDTRLSAEVSASVYMGPPALRWIMAAEI